MLIWWNHLDDLVQDCTKCSSNEVTSLYHSFALSPWPVSNVDNNTLSSTKAYSSPVISWSAFNTLTSGRCASNIKIMIIGHLLQIRLMSTPEILLRWMPSSNFEVNTGSGSGWLCKATSHFLRLFWHSKHFLHFICKLSTIIFKSQQSGRSPKVVALLSLQTLVAI